MVESCVTNVLQNDSSIELTVLNQVMAWKKMELEGGGFILYHRLQLHLDADDDLVAFYKLRGLKCLITKVLMLCCTENGKLSFQEASPNLFLTKECLSKLLEQKVKFSSIWYLLHHCICM